MRNNNILKLTFMSIAVVINILGGFIVLILIKSLPYNMKEKIGVVNG